MKRLAIFALLLCFCAKAVATIFYCGGDPASIQAAHDGAADGDTVVVTNGGFFWTTNVVIVKGINLLATNSPWLIDNLSSAITKPKNQCLFDFETVSNKTYRISGFDFTATGSHPVWGKGDIDLFGFSWAVRVDHCLWSNTWNNSVSVNDWVEGLQDHNTYLGGQHTHPVWAHHPMWGGSSYGFGDGAFYLPQVYGSSNAWYVEDNYFTNSWGYGAVMDGQGGMVVVFRHNVIEGDFLSAHGTESGGRLRSPRRWEIYNNTFSGYNGQQVGMEFRGGTGPIFSNSFTGSWKAIARLSVYRSTHAFPSWGGITGVNGFDSNSPTIYYTGTQGGGNANGIFTPSVNPSWAVNQWSSPTGNYILYDPVYGRFSEIQSNTATAIYVIGDIFQTTIPWYFTNGLTYEIHQTYRSFGAPGAGQGDLLSGQTPTPAWPHELLEPIYFWSNTLNGVAAQPILDAKTTRIQLGREWLDDTVMPGYTPFIYPHPLQNAGTPPFPPTIISQPQNQFASVGHSATFSVQVSGSQPITYQWWRNGSTIAGATQSSYTRANVTPANSGEVYKVGVTNAAGGLESANATLTVSAQVLNGNINLKGNWKLIFGGSGPIPLAYAQAPIDNPLKGMEPNPANSTGSELRFPHSIVYSGVSLGATVVASNTFDWTHFESIINYATNDGSQLVFRFELDDPNWQTSALPAYVLASGIWTTNYDPAFPGLLSPDYTNQILIDCMTNFIAVLGAKYDGDPRLAFGELGLLMNWGEWDSSHNLFTHLAPLSTERAVYYAYTNAFRKTKLVVRYPSGTNDSNNDVPVANNSQMPFGFYDDSFARKTIPTNYTVSPPTDGYSHMLRSEVDSGQTNKWKLYPYGGEAYGPTFNALFSSNPPVYIYDPTPIQSWSNCVVQAHATFMHEPYIFYTDAPPVGFGLNLSWYTNAWMMGYELWAKSYNMATNGGGGLTASVTLTNTGVAPFYYNWQIQLAAVTNSVLGPVWDTPWTLTNVVPGDGAITQTMTTNNAPTGPFTLVMRAVNPMVNGRQLKFANAKQDATLTNWLTLGP